MNIKWIIAAGLAASTVAYVAPANEVEASGFKDINSYSKMGNAIEKLTQRGVMTGYSDGTFRPNIAVNRVQAAKILVEMLQLDTEALTAEDRKLYVFKDVPQRTTNYKYVATLAKAGIIASGEDEQFRPNKRITRGELAIMLYRAYDLMGADELLHFTDVPVDDEELYEAVSMLYSNDLLQGVTSKRFGVNNKVTRGQLALLLHQAERAFLKESPYQDESVMFQASEFGYDGFRNVTTEGAIYKATLPVHTNLKVRATDEGNARLSFQAYRTIERADGTTFEETEDFFYEVMVTEDASPIINDVDWVIDSESVLKINFKRGQATEHVDFATNTYLYGYDGLNLTFTPSNVVLKDDNNGQLGYNDYFVELADDEMDLTVYKTGIFQLHFTDYYGNKEVKLVHVYDEGFTRTYDIYDAKTKLVLDESVLGFEPVRYVVNYSNSRGANPAHIELKDGALIAQPITVGEREITVYGEYGQKQVIVLRAEENAGLLYLNNYFE